jgi:hypothetical protein
MAAPLRSVSMSPRKQNPAGYAPPGRVFSLPEFEGFMQRDLLMNG